MRVLITGAFGYLGGRLAQLLRKRDFEVVLSGRGVPPGAAEFARGFEVRSADVLDPSDVARAVEGVGAVIHLASLDEREAERDPGRALAVSGEGTRLLLEAAERAGVARVLYFSTFHVYGPGSPATIDESVLTRPAHPYGISRLVGESYCRRARLRGQEAIVLRISNGYGAPAWAEVDRWTLAHNDFCRQAHAGREITLASSGQQHRDFVAVSDIAQAAALLLEVEASSLGERLFQVGGARSMSILTIAERVAARARARYGAECAIRRPASVAAEPAVPVDYRIDRLAALGYRPTDQVDLETDRIFALLDESHP